MRHPFEAAPYVARALRPAIALRGRGGGEALTADDPAAWLARERALSAGDQAWLRGLRPETRAMWLASAGSALASGLLYAVLWGVPIAAGLMLGMAVHELGHLALIRRLKLEASPIVFVPFLGAVQKLRTAPKSALDGAQLALAGPLCGLLFALGCKLLFLATGQPTLRLLATAHALLAMLDAMPFGMLDGRRIFLALSRRHRAACACACASLALVTQALWLVPVVLLLGWTATQPAPLRSPPWVAGVYIVLLVCGALLV